MRLFHGLAANGSPGCFFIKAAIIGGSIPSLTIAQLLKAAERMGQFKETFPHGYANLHPVKPSKLKQD